jgi:excinuclease ABC subunit C
MTKEEYKIIASTIPHNPGVYKYFNEEDRIIYVGKAKDLRKRVNSYFAKEHEHYKTRKLVEKIVRIEFTIVPTEKDALLLESSLIKQYQPHYNIALKDDKSYPYIVIKNEPFPRIFFTRRVIRDGSTYLGPFTSVVRVKELLEVVKQTIPLRTCSLPLNEKDITNHKFKSCLEYQIGNCKAPCIGVQSTENYNWYVQQVKEILKGRLGEIKKMYLDEIKGFVEKMEYEKAEIVKVKLQFLQEYNTRSVIVSTTIDNLDICSIHSKGDIAFVNYMSVSNGIVIHSKTIQAEKKLDESDAEILSFAISGLMEQYRSNAIEVVSEIEFDLGEDVKITIPKVGDKLKLLQLSQQNVIYFYEEHRRQKALMLEQADNKMEILEQIQTYLRLSKLPTHIECFDNSNFQGSFPVAAMVCFKDGVPYKKEYRHFHIKTVVGINDFASMKEIVFRRYSRLLKEEKPLPQFVIIDGGKGQLSSAMESIKELGLENKMTVVGLAKNIEEIFFPGLSESFKLPYQSDALRLITFIRDEVHRFGITFHRDTRSKGVIKNELEGIKGIGSETATILLKHFKSVKKIRAASLEEIIEIVGLSKGSIVYYGLMGE